MHKKGFHEIKTGDALPIKNNPYKVPFALRDEMKRQLDEMIYRGIITPSCSEWAAPVILVKKKSLDGTPKYRFCTDFRGLYVVTKIPVYPIPDIKGKLSLMAGSKHFTLLDIESAYWHIPIHPDDNKNWIRYAIRELSVQKIDQWLSRSPEHISENNGRNLDGT
jgi:hypothetical protein